MKITDRIKEIKIRRDKIDRDTAEYHRHEAKVDMIISGISLVGSIIALTAVLILKYTR